MRGRSVKMATEAPPSGASTGMYTVQRHIFHMMTPDNIKVIESPSLWLADMFLTCILYLYRALYNHAFLIRTGRTM